MKPPPNKSTPALRPDVIPKQRDLLWRDLLRHVSVVRQDYRGLVLIDLTMGGGGNTPQPSTGMDPGARRSMWSIIQHEVIDRGEAAYMIL